MRNLGLEIRGQIDNVDGIKGALLGANTASDAETFGDEGDLGLGGDFDAQLSRAHDGAGLFALLPAFLHTCQRREKGNGFAGVRLPWACTVRAHRLGLARGIFSRRRGSGVYLVRVDNGNTVYCQCEVQRERKGCVHTA